MKKLYEKSELGFALVWIGIYCLGMSVFDEISRALGVESIASAVFALAVSIFLLFLPNFKTDKLLNDIHHAVLIQDILPDI